MRVDKSASSSKGKGAGLTRVLRSLMQKAGGLLALSAVSFPSALALPAAAVPDQPILDRL